MIGQGPDEAGLRVAVQEAGLAEYVEFLGVLANPYPEYRAADLFCLPSRTEGLPNVLIEALACGTPVVATDCPSGPREILRDGKFGLLAPVSDPEQLSQRILEALRNRSKWREAARAGRIAMHEQYAAQSVVRSLECLLIQAVQGKFSR